MNESNTLKKIMDQVIFNAFDTQTNPVYLKYRVSIVPKELKSKHGQYVHNDRKIEIFNLGRSPGCTMLTCLHEAAHHIEFMDTGATAHRQPFYERFYQLVREAYRIGLITLEDLYADAQDSKDYEKLEEYFGPTSHWDLSLSEQAEKKYVLIANAYEQKEALKERNYRFLQNCHSWGKEFPNELYALRETEVLTSIYPDLSINIVRTPALLFSWNYYLAIAGAYEKRDVLKQHGYRWNAYGVKNA